MNTKRRIDWEEVKVRVRANQAAIEQGLLAGDGKRLELIYRNRAREFANRNTAAAQPTDAWPALIFAVGNERLCLPLSALIEVLPFSNCSLLPGAPPELLGVINVRGRICSVLDLAGMLDIPPADNCQRGYIVLMRHATDYVGLKVDEVARISLETTAPSGEHGDALPGRYLRGMTSDRASILDPLQILSHPVLKTDSKSRQVQRW